MTAAGEDQASGNPGFTRVRNPATGEVLEEVPRFSAEQVDATIGRSRAAFESWRRVSVRGRRDVLHRIAGLVERDREVLAALESANTGKPITAARGEMDAVAATFHYYAGAVDKFGGNTIPGNAPGTLMTFREPIGVCAAVVPWNFPLVITGWKVAPALAMGNSVVVKPAELTPLTALALARLTAEAGLPEGVLSVVTGSGSQVGEALVGHPLVDKVSFTGSTEVGVRVMTRAAPTVKRVSLELGGKSASIVFADADMDVSVESSFWSAFDNAGQDCCARSRMLVERGVFDEFADRLRRRAESVRVGDPSDEETEMGPLISPDHRESVERHLALGDGEGARRLCGGDRLDGLGNYLTPAVYVDVRPDMRIATDEIFGPVVAVLPFDGEDEAVELANRSVYGLSGSIWTRDIGRALRVARAVETGMLSINSSSSAHIEAPFGGVKRSGIGREQGMAALEHYTELKTVFVAEG